MTLRTLHQWNTELRKRFGQDTTVTECIDGPYSVLVCVPSYVDLDAVRTFCDTWRPVNLLFRVEYLPDLPAFD
jgi:hypothetical protein